MLPARRGPPQGVSRGWIFSRRELTCVNDFLVLPVDIVIRGGYIYVALRDESGDCPGTIEVTQDLTEKRKIEGERRLLNYS